MMRTFSICLLAAVLGVLSSGCDRDKVKVYRVDKDDTVAPTTPTTLPATPAPAADSGSMPAPTETPASRLKYTLPDGWQEAAPGEMRVASFLVTNSAGRPADVGVIPMPTTGQEIQLVNMWRQQMQLPAATNEPPAEIVSVGGDDSAKLFDIASDANLVDGKARARILVAVSTHDSMSWFFKMVGEESFVEAQKPVFKQFLKSVSYSELPAPSTMDLSKLPPSHPTIPGMGAGNVTAPVAVPAGWQAAPLTQFLIAKFTVAGADGSSAQVNVSSLAGEGGGLAANVNRWRAQLGLAPVTGADLAKLATMDVPDGKATLIDISGTDGRTGKPARLIGVVLPLGGQTWFYKLMGDESIVAQQKDAFTKFIQSAKYPDVH